MKLFGPLAQAVVLAGVIASAGVVPAFAGPAETAALEKYLGTWNGTGTMTGGQTQSVTCKMALSEGNGGKLNYTGRCNLAGAQLSVTGTIAWIDAKHRYEAVMNSGVGGFKGVAVGEREGDSIVFDLKQRANDDQGNDISIAAAVVLSDKSISVDFHAVFNDSGEKIDAKIPFTKAA
ncbi:MAG TPA: hypothetical protein VHZ56_14080 [Devosia sp.]|nr:hypothetical protein [Devosia sp.]